jgi:hypothetical protein
MSKPARTHDLINDAAKKGISVARFLITKAQGEETKRVEREQGHGAAFRELLVCLRRFRLPCD